MEKCGLLYTYLEILNCSEPKIGMLKLESEKWVKLDLVMDLYSGYNYFEGKNYGSYKSKKEIGKNHILSGIVNFIAQVKSNDIEHFLCVSFF